MADTQKQIAARVFELDAKVKGDARFAAETEELEAGPLHARYALLRRGIDLGQVQGEEARRAIEELLAG